MKFTPRTIIVIFCSIAAIILSVAFFRFYQPNEVEAGYYTTYGDQLETEANKLSASKKKLVESFKLREELDTQWQSVVVRKTPPDRRDRGGINLGVNRYQLVNDVLNFRNKIQLAVNRQVRIGGVKVINGPNVPAFSDNPATIIEADLGYQTYGYPVKIYDFGRVTVQGTASQIRANVEAWSRIPNFIAVTDGLTIEGTAPVLTGTYNVSMIMYLRYSNLFPTVPAGVGSAAAPGAAGAAGGGPRRGTAASSGGGAPAPPSAPSGSGAGQASTRVAE